MPFITARPERKNGFGTVPMPLRTPAEKKTAKQFLKKLGLRLAAAAAVTSRYPCLCLKGRCPDSKRPLSEQVPVPKHDAVLLFDEVTFGILADLIEEMASEAGAGEWTSTVGHFDDFTALRPRYAALGKTLDTVRAWGVGPAPKKGIPGVDLLAVESRSLARYRLVLYRGPKVSAVLLAKEVAPVRKKVKGKPGITCRRYIGFYSFCPYLLLSLRRRLHLVGCGLDCMVKHWEKSFDLPAVTPADLAFLTGAHADGAALAAAPAPPKPRNPPKPTKKTPAKRPKTASRK